MFLDYVYETQLMILVCFLLMFGLNLREQQIVANHF